MIARSRGEHDNRRGQTRALAGRELAAAGPGTLAAGTPQTVPGRRPRRGVRSGLMAIAIAGALVWAGWGLARLSAGAGGGRSAGDAAGVAGCV